MFTCSYFGLYDLLNNYGLLPDESIVKINFKKLAQLNKKYWRSRYGWNIINTGSIMN